MIRRREYLMTVGAVVGGTGLAGCFSSSNVDGETVVQQSVTNEETTFRFDAETGNRINVFIEIRDGPGVIYKLSAPLGTQVAIGEIESEKTLTHTVQDGGLFVLELSQGGGNDGEVYVEVGIES